MDFAGAAGVAWVIGADIGLSQSALSQHLAVLRGKHLVRTRRKGQSILYSLASKEATALMHTLHEEFCAPKRRRSEASKSTPRLEMKRGVARTSLPAPWKEVSRFPEPRSQRMIFDSTAEPV